MSSEMFDNIQKNEERTEALTENAPDPAIMNKPVGRAELMLQAIKSMLMRRNSNG